MIRSVKIPRWLGKAGIGLGIGLALLLTFLLIPRDQLFQQDTVFHTERVSIPDSGRSPASESGTEGEVSYFYRALGTYGTSKLQYRCEDWVRLEGPQFKVGDQDYQLHGVNFRIGIAARLTQARNNFKQYELFLTPDSNVEPDNQSFCRDPADWDLFRVCCDSADSCVPKLQKDHIAKLSLAGVTSVRLLMDIVRLGTDEKVPYFYVDIDLVNMGQGERTLKQARIRLNTATGQSLFFSAVRDGIRLLGAHGIRSLLLLNGRTRFKDHPGEQAAYTDLLTKLAHFLKNETDLIGYDLYNEPVYNDKGISINKSEARTLVQGWVDAIHLVDSRHLITIGNSSPADTIGAWDPTILPIDFQSPHIYSLTHNRKISPKSDALIKQQIYVMSLASCGQPCPYLGKFDGANCKVSEGPVGTQGSIWKDGMYYTNRENTCPVGWKEGPNCKVALFDPGRESGFILNQPLYYVKPQAGNRCPAGAQFDGFNCLVHSAPPGVRALEAREGGETKLYYDYIYKAFGGTDRCRAPAYDDGTKCRVPTAAGYSGFFLYRPIFYVTAQTCERGKRPIVIGETGFSVSGLRDTGAVWKFRDASGQELPVGYGNNQDQADYLRKLFALSHACQGQGLLWWQYGDVHWGDINDQFGLFTNARNVGYPVRPSYRDTLFPRPAATVMRDEVNYLKSRSPCVRPESFYKVEHDAVFEDDTYRYSGTVLDGSTGKPLPNVTVSTWPQMPDNKWGPYAVFYTNVDGRFEIRSKYPLVGVTATHYGYDNSPLQNDWITDSSGRRELKQPLRIQSLPKEMFTPYSPPNPGGRSCNLVPTRF